MLTFVIIPNENLPIKKYTQFPHVYFIRSVYGFNNDNNKIPYRGNVKLGDVSKVVWQSIQEHDSSLCKGDFMQQEIFIQQPYEYTCVQQISPHTPKLNI